MDDVSEVAGSWALTGFCTGSTFGGGYTGFTSGGLTCSTLGGG